MNQITQYIPCLDKLYLNLKANLTECPFGLDSFNLLTVKQANAKDSYQIGSFTLKRETCKSKNYRLQYSIYYKNNHFATTYFHSLTDFNNQTGLIPLHLLNKSLYTEWIPTLTKFLTQSNLNISTFSQLDIALDTNQDAEAVFFKLEDNSKNFRLLGKKIAPAISTLGKRSKGGKREDSYQVGSTKSSRSIKIYNKSKEITDKGNIKQYITEHHKINGLDTTQPVWRVELKLTNDCFKDYTSLFVNEHGELLSKHKMKRQTLQDMAETAYEAKTQVDSITIDYTQLDSPAYLIALFKIFNNIDFRLKDNKTLKHCTKIEFINLNTYNKQLIMKQTQYKDSKTDNQRQHKQMLRKLVETFKQTQQPTHFEYAITYADTHHVKPLLNEVIKEYNISTYVAMNFPRYFEDAAIEHKLQLSM